jgi:hypothetical protein
MKGTNISKRNIDTSVFPIHLPLYDLVIRPQGMIAIHNSLVFNPSVGQRQVYNGHGFAFVPHPVGSGLVVISNYQPTLVYNFFQVCSFPPFGGPRVPALAVGIEVFGEIDAAFPTTTRLYSASIFSSLICLLSPLVSDHQGLRF